MKIRIGTLFFFVLVVVLQSGCVKQNKLSSVIYFQQRDSLLASNIINVETKIQMGDRLIINVSSISPESVLPYNASAISSGGLSGFLVEKDSAITFPQVGKIKVVDLTKVQLENLLVRELKKYVNDPIISVQFLNFKVTILGEVTKPGSFQVPEGKLNIVEAIGLAGDLKQYSNRSKVMVIREKNGIREFGYVDFLSRNIFNSPYYNLCQNDIIYIEPLVGKVESDQTFVKSLSIVTTVISLVSTLFFIVLNISK